VSIEQKLLKRIAAEQLKKRQIEAQGKRKIEPNLKKISDALDDYYLFGKLKVYCSYLSYTQIISQEKLAYKKKDLQLIEPVLEKLNSDCYQHPAIIIYNKIRLLFESLIVEETKIQLSNYEDTATLIKNSQKTFTVEERLELYSFLSNFCIKKVNGGFTAYWERLFLLNNEIINLKYFRKRSINEVLPANFFKNVVSVALRLSNTPLSSPIQTIALKAPTEEGFDNRLEWVKQFIEVYHLKLEKSARQLYYNYATASIAFHEGNYKLAFEQLGNPSHIQEVIFNLDLKMLLLKILYEINYYDSDFLETKDIDVKKVLEAYRGLIRDEKKRKRQLTYQLPFHENFEVAFRKLYSLYEKSYKTWGIERNPLFLKRKKTLLAEVQLFKYPYKTWLTNKLKKIGQKKTKTSRLSEIADSI